ncbi:MAG: proline--tRNA ligase [Candidatus Kariarchaeaceae archaeon]|jgi:prolyl-tRNA synthetase
MRVADLLGNPLKEMPVVFDITSQKLLIKGGYLREEQNEIIGLPLYTQLMFKLIDVIKNHIGTTQEVSLVGSKCAKKRVHELIQAEITSYKQLPLQFYYLLAQIEKDTNFSKGLLYPKVNYTYSLYSLYSSESTSSLRREEIISSWKVVLEHLGLPIMVALAKKSENLMIEERSKASGYEFVYITPIGQESIVCCINCDYTSRIEVSQRKVIASKGSKKMKEIKTIVTPQTSSIQELVELLEIPSSSCSKIVFYHGTFSRGSKVILSIVRGDTEVNEYAIKHITGALSLRPAEDAEIIEIGAFPGFASAIGVDREKCIVVVDVLVTKSFNLVAGANEADKHILNTNFERDYTSDYIGQIALVSDGDNCIECENPLSVTSGISIVTYTQEADQRNVYLDPKGKKQMLQVHWSQLSLTKLFGCIVEEFHDNNGIILPYSIAPFQVILLLLGKRDATRAYTERLYQDISEHLSILYDDRNTRAGVKFAEADLRGFPLRLVVSDKLFEDGLVELKQRGSTRKKLIELGDVIQFLQTLHINLK